MKIYLFILFTLFYSNRIKLLKITLPAVTLSNRELMHDDDGNENGKKAIGLDKQNNNFARFFAHFFAVVA